MLISNKQHFQITNKQCLNVAVVVKLTEEEQMML